MAAQPPVAERETEKEGMDLEKSGLPGTHSPADDNSSDVADSTLAALQRVRTQDEHHPIHWSSAKKWIIVFWYCLLQVFVTLTTTTYVSAEFLVQEQYGGTTQVVALGQSMFIIGTAIGPAFLGPLSYVVPPRMAYWLCSSHLVLHLDIKFCLVCWSVERRTPAVRRDADGGAVSLAGVPHTLQEAIFAC